MQIGDRLKEAREAKQLSLDNIQETTKIQKRYLTAIEQGNFDVLPGTFYARAFIKEYALAVDLDPKQLLDEHKDEIPSANEETEQYTRFQHSRSSRDSRSLEIFSLIPKIIVILLIIGIFFVFWFLYQKAFVDGDSEPANEESNDVIIHKPADNGEDLDDEHDENKSSENNEDDEDENTADEAIEFDVKEEGSGNVPESTIDVLNASEDVILSLETKERSWLAVINEDGEELFSGEFASADSPMDIDISDEKSVHLNIGNTSQLKININDETLEYPLETDDYVHQKIWLHIKE